MRRVLLRISLLLRSSKPRIDLWIPCPIFFVLTHRYLLAVLFPLSALGRGWPKDRVRGNYCGAFGTTSAAGLSVLLLSMLIFVSGGLTFTYTFGCFGSLQPIAKTLAIRSTLVSFMMLTTRLRLSSRGIWIAKAVPKNW